MGAKTQAEMVNPSVCVGHLSILDETNSPRAELFHCKATQVCSKTLTPEANPPFLDTLWTREMKPISALILTDQSLASTSAK
jgi:hypothetical protein